MSHKHSGKSHPNRKAWRAVELLREQKRLVDLQHGESRMEITPEEAGRLILTNCYAWKIRNGLVRAVWHKQWDFSLVNWRNSHACVLYPSENYAR